VALFGGGDCVIQQYTKVVKKRVTNSTLENLPERIKSSNPNSHYIILNQKKCPAGFAFGSHAGQDKHANKHTKNTLQNVKGKNPKC
jgi:hypothetical protein